MAIKVNAIWQGQRQYNNKIMRLFLKFACFNFHYHLNTQNL